MGWGEFTQVDLLAMTMIGMTLLAFGVILMLVISMHLSASRRDVDVDELLDEVEAEEKKGQESEPVAAKGEEPEVLEEWERKGDWWKEEE